MKKSRYSSDQVAFGLDQAGLDAVPVPGPTGSD